MQVLSCVIAIVLAGAVALAATDQKEVDALIAELNKAYEAKNDDGVPPIIDKMVLAYRSADEKNKGEIAKAIARAFSQRREEKEGEKLFAAAGAALSEMGEIGTKVLVTAIKSKDFKKRTDLRCELLRYIGAQKDPKNTKLIIDFLKDNEPKLVAAAADALGNYREGSEKLRKELVEELVKAYATQDANVKKNPKDQVQKDRLQAYEVNMNNALLALTGQSFEDATKWQAWFNDNKNKPWSKEKANG
ncbi:MAG: hypothetical protein U1E76_07385 [Planctomycetota bacterium]